MAQHIQLSKSDFLLYLDAPRHLWADKQDLIYKTLSVFDVNVMNQGYEVESLAKEDINNFVINTDDNQHILFQQSYTDKQFTIRTDALVYKPSTDLYEIINGTSVKKISMVSLINLLS